MAYQPSKWNFPFDQTNLTSSLWPERIFKKPCPSGHIRVAHLLPTRWSLLRWYMETFSKQFLSLSNNPGLWNIWFTTSLPKRSRNSDRKRYKKNRIIAQRITCSAIILLASIRRHMSLLCGVWDIATRTTCARREIAYCVYLSSSLRIRRFPGMAHHRSVNPLKLLRDQVVDGFWIHPMPWSYWKMTQRSFRFQGNHCKRS